MRSAICRQLINQVYQSLANIGTAPAAPAARPQPAVSVKKSIQPDYLVCLEDGKKLKMLKRHLKTAYNMTPEAYRERWGLAPDYPMVAPNYARQRSRLAKEIGLGTRARRGARLTATRRIADHPVGCHRLDGRFPLYWPG